MAVQIPTGFDLRDDVIVEITILSIIIIKETRKGFINNSSFLIPHSSFLIRIEKNVNQLIAERGGRPCESAGITYPTAARGAAACSGSAFQT